MALCCIKIQQPSNPCLSLSDLCTLSLCLTKLTRQTRSTTYRDQSPGIRPPTTAARATTRGQRLLELSHAPPKILDSQVGSQPHASPRRPCRPPIYLAWESGDLTNLHTPTRAAGYLSHHHAPELAFHTPKNRCWCHQVTSSPYVSSHASTFTSALVHVSGTS